MRVIVFGILATALGAAFGAAIAPHPAAAQYYGNGAWCAKTGISGSENCSFATFEQCQRYILGFGPEYCTSNPHPRVIVAPPRRRVYRSPRY
jgi:hypothetical protein